MGVDGWFQKVHRLVHAPTLRENRRQEAAEQSALETWRTGDHRRALELLAVAGHVHVTETTDGAHSQIVAARDELRRAGRPTSSTSSSTWWCSTPST